jgi:hypothetical protein
MHTTTDKHEEKKENTETMMYKKRKYNIGRLKNKSTKFLYQQRLTNKLHQNEFADMEEMYNYLKSAFMKQQREHWEKRSLTKEGKQSFWDAEIEKERQNKKQLFLKWLSTKDNNEKVKYTKAQAKISRMVANYRKKNFEKRNVWKYKHI